MPLLRSLLVAVCAASTACCTTTADAQQQEPVRARDLGVPFSGAPGPLNAITDVDGVEVGHTTIIEGSGRLEVGKGPVRTGVTAILPRGHRYDPVFAGWHALNGNGEMTGTTWVEESGFLEGPIMITNTHSVGVVRDAVIEWQYKNQFFNPLPDEPDVFWALPVVAETYDGLLNDMNGFHVTKETTTIRNAPASGVTALSSGRSASRTATPSPVHRTWSPCSTRAERSGKRAAAIHTSGTIAHHPWPVQ